MQQKIWAVAIMTILLTGCYNQTENEVQGYVEGDFIRVSLPESGIVETVLVRRGEYIEKGKLLFTLNSDREKALLEKAWSQLAVAKSELSNIKAPKRDTEIKVIESEIRELKANITYTKKLYNRRLKLSKVGAVSANEVDRSKSEDQAMEAEILAAESRLVLAKQSIGREGEIEIAQNTLRLRKAIIREAEANLALRKAIAPTSGVVNDVIYRAGETVSNGQTVIELLPPENVKARFYLSPEQVAWAKADPILTLQCKGCGDGIIAKISFISSKASYRPPILYSRDQSEKLAFLVEAVPQKSTNILHPGQPVTVIFPK